MMKQFEAKQEEMLLLGMRLGLSHPDVVKVSQELDELHNALLRKEREGVTA